MNISIRLPYKENFSPEYPGAVSIFINSVTNLSTYKDRITVFGNTNFEKKFTFSFEFKENVFSVSFGLLIFNVVGETFLNFLEIK